MLVTTKKYNRDMAKLKAELANTQLVLRASLGEKEYARVTEAVRKSTEQDRLEDFDLGFEELPIANPLIDENKLPPRSEYNERLETAIKLFQENHPVSEVAVRLAVARKTARRYLRIAITKRIVKKADFDQLNQ